MASRHPHATRYRLAFSFFGALWALLLAPHHAAAQQPAPLPGPIHERVAVQLIDIGKIDVSAGTYNFDFYLSFQCDRPCDGNAFTVANGTIVGTPETVVNEPQHHVYRVHADLATAFGFSRYPFTVHYLHVDIEPQDPAKNNANQVLYEADTAQSGIGPLIDASGWQLMPHFRAIASTHTHPFVAKPHAYYEFGVVIDHPLLGSFIKSMLPALFVMVTGFLAFLLVPEKNGPVRLGIGTTALSTMTLWHINVTSSLPPLSYPTYFDKFMVINYCVLTCILASTVVGILSTDWWTNRDSGRFEAISRVAIPGLWVVLQGIILISLIRDSAGGLI